MSSHVAFGGLESSTDVPDGNAMGTGRESGVLDGAGGVADPANILGIAFVSIISRTGGPHPG